MTWNAGKGKSYRFLCDHVGYEGDDCLQWPFSRDKHGRGMLRANGVQSWAHRLMCRLAHGDPPTPKHTAAHSCGKGHEGCVNPRHLSWKTQKENLADCAIHGTQPKHYDGPQGRLTPAQAQEIKDARGIKTQGQLAAMYGMSEGAINDIWRGRTWKKIIKTQFWTPEQDAKLKRALAGGCTFREAAAIVGRPKGSTMNRAYYIGLTSGRPPPPSRVYKRT